MRNLLVVFVLITLTLAGCQATLTPTGEQPAPAQPAATAATSSTDVPAIADESELPATEAQSLTEVTLSVGFVPNVQFAPFYTAIEKGYYAEQGLDVEIEYGMEHDFLRLLGTGQRQFVIASGDQVILARSQGLPVVYVMNWHRRFPIAVFSLQELSEPQDLAGKTVGIPGLFGASYIGWQALVYATGLDAAQVELESIGFTQTEAVATEQVDVAVGYAVNEPIQLEQQGYDPDVILVADYIDLVANGIVTTEDIIDERPDLVQRMVAGSLMGLRDTIANPEEAFEIVLEYVPEAGDQRETQMMVLQESIKFWESDRLGYTDLEAWEVSQAFLKDAGLVEETVEVRQMFTNRFVEGAGVE